MNGNSESSATRLLPAAQYVRMSTEHQRYSTENQADVIAKYANDRGMVIIMTYADEGKSGLNLEGRAGLLRMLADVQSGEAEYKAILVYDVSRWGRFQDADESGYWEYVCKRSGVSVHYCAEQFSNDGSLPSVILKNLKRTMAGEYSRELSTKVFAGQCRLVEHGYRQGGPAGYGFRRLLIDEHHQPKGTLQRGQRKSLQTDRVILISGPEEEQATVAEIYKLFVHDGKNELQIADLLNRKSIVSDSGKPWSRAIVHQILINPKYIGSNVYNRRSFKLKKRRIVNPESMWVRKEGAFPALIDIETFSRARRIIDDRNRRFSNDEMLAMLKGLLSSQGKLSGFIIDEQEGLPSSGCYASRFGSLIRAYSLIGYSPDKDYSYLQINTRLREMHSSVLNSLLQNLRDHGSQVEFNAETGIVTVNREIGVCLVLSRARVLGSGSFRWIIRLNHFPGCDLTIAVRMDSRSESVVDYYVLPSIDHLADKVRLASYNPLVLDVYRTETLEPLFRACKRAKVGDFV